MQYNELIMQYDELIMQYNELIMQYNELIMQYDELVKRLLKFVQKCFICDNKLVNFTIRYAVWHGRMKSPLGCSV